ncbi:MAG: hypothetical protein AB1546_16170, partial [bacterium]
SLQFRNQKQKTLINTGVFVYAPSRTRTCPPGLGSVKEQKISAHKKSALAKWKTFCNDFKKQINT